MLQERHVPSLTMTNQKGQGHNGGHTTDKNIQVNLKSKQINFFNRLCKGLGKNAQ